MRRIEVNLPGEDRSYAIWIAPGLRRRLSAVLAPLGLPPRLFVVTDPRVGDLYGQEVLASLKEAGFVPEFLIAPQGERAKSWPVAARLARQLLALKADRGTALLALGGGVVGDLTGFLASIFMRGLPFLQAPTTLLAMVDAAIGGKTAINLKEGKNLLGTFYQPRAVLVDPEFLDTLPWAHRRNGLAEVVKAGFIRDPELLEGLLGQRRTLFSRQEELNGVIHRAAAIKAAVVSEDEQEAGLRRILNFGHTLGHALEQASGFRLPHGRAVAWGMAGALELSQSLAGLPQEQARRGRQILNELGLTRRPPKINPEAVLQALPADKKRRGGELVFVLLKNFGEPVVLEGVPLAQAAQCLEILLAPR